MTGEGRVPAGDFRAHRRHRRGGRAVRADRSRGGRARSTGPSGNAAYAYGAYFHQYLADTYGAERLTRLADATSGRIPFFDAGAFKNVFDRSSTNLWDDFREAREHAGVPRSDTDARARATHPPRVHRHRSRRR